MRNDVSSLPRPRSIFPHDDFCTFSVFAYLARRAPLRDVFTQYLTDKFTTRPRVENTGWPDFPRWEDNFLVWGLDPVEPPRRSHRARLLAYTHNKHFRALRHCHGEPPLRYVLFRK